jgi:hypothetical protein
MYGKPQLSQMLFGAGQFGVGVPQTIQTPLIQKSPADEACPLFFSLNFRIADRSTVTELCDFRERKLMFRKIYAPLFLLLSSFRLPYRFRQRKGGSRSQLAGQRKLARRMA